jgi:hypothetical protein
MIDIATDLKERFFYGSIWFLDGTVRRLISLCRRKMRRLSSYWTLCAIPLVQSRRR